ncbi:hypothetical protein HYX00_03415 [Candidatus Woesearchaeota archaeon]|nr:hypothetical protein [Candidatus Woesearchaeota archaeon]
MKVSTCKCGGNIKLDRCLMEGFLVGCMKCDKCGEILFTPEQTKQLIKLREANQVVEGKRKIVKVGSSIAALLPKKVETYGIKEGVVDKVRILSSNSLEVQFDKDIV